MWDPTCKATPPVPILLLFCCWLGHVLNAFATKYTIVMGLELKVEF